MRGIIKIHVHVSICVLIVGLAGCGYTNRAILPNNIKTIAVPTFKNQIVQGDTYTYEAGMETDITNAIINRINYDGNLKVVSSDKADAILEGALTKYDQETLRYEDRAKVKEYRLFIGVDISLIDNRTGEIIWTERNFTGRTEYFRTGTYATTERTAMLSARDDLAKKVVDRIIEDW
ncbi:MAG: LptE family protein [Candidatus Omnitrophica bacterium]|nr:LptE family protein [Candidatus Omnitrophota bacterium]